MKAEIIYATMTGHSKKIASAISKNLSIPAHNLKANPEIKNCDLLFIVSGIYGGECKPQLLEYVKTLSPSKVKKVGLITSSTKVVSQKTIKEVLINKGIEVEEYLCQGGFLFMAFSHPNKDEIMGAVKFAQQLIK